MLIGSAVQVSYLHLTSCTISSAVQALEIDPMPAFKVISILIWDDFSILFKMNDFNKMLMNSHLFVL
ncbi:hypothetical protein R6Q59_024402 [Mikania micrantha]